MPQSAYAFVEGMVLLLLVARWIGVASFQPRLSIIPLSLGVAAGDLANFFGAQALYISCDLRRVTCVGWHLHRAFPTTVTCMPLSLGVVAGDAATLLGAPACWFPLCLSIPCRSQLQCQLQSNHMTLVASCRYCWASRWPTPPMHQHRFQSVHLYSMACYKLRLSCLCHWAT